MYSYRNEHWILTEKSFDIRHQGKCESTMHLANGYLGIRSAFEETYPYQTRGMFAAGTYNRCDEEVTELPNAADTCGMDILLDDELFSMATGIVENYERTLNLYTGELKRCLRWTSPSGKVYDLVFRRFVSHTDLHTYGIQVQIKPVSGQSRIRISTGINARMTNSGAQHFVDGMKRVIDKKYLFLAQSTSESNIIFAHGCTCEVLNAELLHTDFEMERRLLMARYTFIAEQGEYAVLDKICTLFTSNDFNQTEEQQLLDVVMNHLSVQSKAGYLALKEENDQWYETFWQKNNICIDTEIDKIVLASHYAQFCLQSMIPPDSRSSIAAKGLSGEGYKGHIFWDTEIFMMPYFLYTQPEKARQLLDYRLGTLEQCMENARLSGYRGIMFPWESTTTGKEETPKYTSMNILTGKAARVWSGDKEHHITADVALAAWKYWMATGDESFLEEGGALLIIGCALFWISRASFNAETDRYEINDIIGPDEYTEHINNNAYSNYMARAAAQYALEVFQHLSEDNQQEICSKLEEHGLESILRHFIDKVYLPMPGENGVIAQDDTFLQKIITDIRKYRDDNVKQTILKEYSRSQVNDMQVLKQADVVMLMYVLGDLFDNKIKKDNLDYYEPKTIHDSSLSRAIHALVACSCDEIECGYKHFLKAIDIDIGNNPVSSDSGIHAASMGGIWLTLVEGFAGVRSHRGMLYIDPKLPEAMRSISFRYTLKGIAYYIAVSKNQISVSCCDEEEKIIFVSGEMRRFTKNLVLSSISYN